MLDVSLALTLWGSVIFTFPLTYMVKGFESGLQIQAIWLWGSWLVGCLDSDDLRPFYFSVKFP